MFRRIDMQMLKATNKFFILQGLEHDKFTLPELFFDEEQADRFFKLKVVEKIMIKHSKIIEEAGFEDKGIDTDIDRIIAFVYADDELMKEMNIELKVNFGGSRLISAHFIDDNSYYELNVCFQSLECKRYEY